MKTNLLTGELSSKSIKKIAILFVAAIALLYAGKILYDRLASQTKSPSAVRREIFAFLKDKSGARDFSLNLKEGLAQMASIEKQAADLREETLTLSTTITNLQTQLRTNRQDLTAADQELRKLKTAAGIAQNTRNANTNRNARAGTNATPAFDLAAASQTNESFKAIYEKEQSLNAKQTQISKWQGDLNTMNAKLRSRQGALTAQERELRALQAGNAELTLARQCQQKLQNASSWQEIFKSLGQELWLVDHLLSNTNIEMRQTGLRLADQARVDAYSTAENSWLACRIIEGYIWPNIDLTDARATNGPSMDQLLNSAGNTLLNSSETNSYIRNLKLAIAQDSKPARADNNRMKLAQFLEQNGSYDDALTYFRAIQTTNLTANATKRIAAIEDKLKKPKKK
jgi:hypothetical protein